MHTEITKNYRWGFALTEQDLRRTAQVAHDSFNKISGGGSPDFSMRIKLKDGSIVNTTTFDDLFALENSGDKLIHEISLHWELVDNEVTQKIGIEYQNGAENIGSWTSISYIVYGATRDWAFVTASEIDERVKRTKLISWQSIFASKWVLMVWMLIGMFATLILATYLAPREQYHVELERLYASGQIKDPIVALIKLEQMKSQRNLSVTIYPLIAMYAMMGILFATLVWVMPRISPGYNFCWGDYMQVYERSKRLRSAIWTLIVLATLVSIAANFFSKKLGI